MEKLVLVDGNSLLNRSFYATPIFTTKSGTPTNGVFGFIKLLLRIFADKKPTHVVVAFDLYAPTFRHKLYSEYKAGRRPMPDDLVVQVPILKEVLQIMGIKICELEGYEADDVIGTLAKKFKLPTYVYTGDRDSYQLVDETTSVCFTRKGVSDILELTKDNFKDEVGINPCQIIDLKALMGDSSDNIPGVAGVGEKKAKTLLEQYGDIDGVYAHIDEIKGALHDNLVNGKESAYFSRQLATIDVNVPLDVQLSECMLRTPYPRVLKEKFAELEFKSLTAANIFSEEETNSYKKAESHCGKLHEEGVESVEDAIERVNRSASAYVVADLDATAFRFVTMPADWEEDDDLTEYMLPIKESLLDAGFYENELTPLLQAIFSGERRVICYSVKEMMHRLKSFGVAFTAPYEDVSVLKCISDGLANTDSMSYYLAQNALPERNTAYGLAHLWKRYLRPLTAEERDLYERVELPLVRVLYSMEDVGVCVNEEVLAELSVRYQKEIEDVKRRIYELAGEEFNINSTQQLGVVLFEKLKIADGVKKNKTTKYYKTTAEELEKYAPQSEIVRCLLRYRKIQKLQSTYVEGFKPLVKNGKVHTTYNQTNTVTGRLSSSSPNLQNIPIRTDEGRELRKLFTAEVGCVLVDADYSQIELRLLAHFSGCKELIEAYCQGRDIHATTASQVFGVPIDQVTAEQRISAKAVNFGIIYGMSAFGLGNDLNITAKRAQEYIDKYFETYSDVREYMQKNVETAKTQGCVTTLLGRRRVMNEVKSSNYNVRQFGERAAMNMPLQGTSADIIKIAMNNVYSRLQEGGYKAKLVLQVHDELIVNCPVTEQEAVANILKEEMENAVSLSVPLTVDITVGRTWFDTK